MILLHAVLMANKLFKCISFGGLVIVATLQCNFSCKNRVENQLLYCIRGPLMNLMSKVLDVDK